MLIIECFLNFISLLLLCNFLMYLQISKEMVIIELVFFSIYILAKSFKAKKDIESIMLNIKVILMFK